MSVFGQMYVINFQATCFDCYAAIIRPKQNIVYVHTCSLWDPISFTIILNGTVVNSWGQGWRSG